MNRATLLRQLNIMLGGVDASELSTSRIREGNKHPPDAVVISYVDVQKCYLLNLDGYLLASLRLASAMFHYSLHFSSRSFRGHHLFWNFFSHCNYSDFGNFFFLSDKIRDNNRDGRVAFNVLSSASSVTFHAASGVCTRPNKYQTIPFRLYRDHGLTNGKNTHALRRLDFEGDALVYVLEC